MSISFQRRALGIREVPFTPDPFFFSAIPLMYQYGEKVINQRERQAPELLRLPLTAAKKAVSARPVESLSLAVCPNSDMAVWFFLVMSFLIA